MDVSFGADSAHASAVWSSCGGSAGVTPCQYAITRTTDGWAHSNTLPTIYSGDDDEPAISELSDGSTLIDTGDIGALTFSLVAPGGSTHHLSAISAPQTVGSTNLLTPGLGLADSSGNPGDIAVVNEATMSIGPLSGSSAKSSRLDIQQESDGALWTIACPDSRASPCQSSTSTDGGASWRTLNSYPQSKPVSGASIVVGSSTYTSLLQFSGASNQSNSVAIFAGQAKTTSGTPATSTQTPTGSRDSYLVSVNGDIALVETDESTATSKLQTVNPTTGALGAVQSVDGQVFGNVQGTVAWTDGLTTIGVFSHGFGRTSTVSPH